MLLFNLGHMEHVIEPYNFTTWGAQNNVMHFMNPYFCQDMTLRAFQVRKPTFLEGQEDRCSKNMLHYMYLYMCQVMQCNPHSTSRKLCKKELHSFSHCGPFDHPHLQLLNEYKLFFFHFCNCNFNFFWSV